MLAQHRLLTVGETALLLRQSQRSVRDKIARGEIPSLRIGIGPRAPIRVETAELERWLFSPKAPASGAFRNNQSGRGSPRARGSRAET